MKGQMRGWVQPAALLIELLPPSDCGHIVGSVVNIFHRRVYVPHGSCIFSRVEPGGFYYRLTRPRDMRSRAKALYS